MASGQHRGKKELLNKELNFNVKDTNKKEYLAELEHMLKIIGIAEETKHQIRQFFVPALTDNT